MRTERTERDEYRPLVSSKKRSHYFKIFALFPFYGGIGFPTAILSFFAALTNYEKQLGEVDTWSELLKIVSEDATPESLVYSTVVFICAEGVLTFMNKRYFFPAIQTVWSLFYRFARREVTVAHEWFVLFWSILASLAFGEIGAQTFRFLGLPGEVGGFAMMFVVYFITRYMSVIYFLKNITDRDYRRKKEYLNLLRLYSLEDIEISVLIGTPSAFDQSVYVGKAVETFIQSLQAGHDQRFSRRMWRYFVNKPTGIFFVCYTSPIVLSSLLPVTVAGFDRLTHLPLGRASDYQDVGSLTFGSFSVLLTLIFYEMNIWDFPGQLITTLFEVVNKFKKGNWWEAVMQLMLTMVIGGSSFAVGLAFRLVALTAAENDFGWFGILPEWFSDMAPNGMLLAVTLMLWSHLQELLNHQFCEGYRLTEEFETVTQVDRTNVNALLLSSELRFSEEERGESDNAMYQKTIFKCCS